jgi:hypothetical protein
MYRGLVDLVGSETKGKGHVEILNVSQVADGDEKF